MGPFKKNPSVHSCFASNTFDAIISFLQAKDGCDRAGRADAPFLLKDTVSAFSRYAEQQFRARPHTLGVGRAGFTDAFLLVIPDNYFLILIHGTHPLFPDPQVPHFYILPDL